MVTVSYAILVNDEYEEIQKLVQFLFGNWKAGDEIVIVQDYKGSADEQTENGQLVSEYLRRLTIRNNFTFFQHPLDHDFSQQKNYLNSKCTKDYIFNIDTDEMLTEDLMANLHAIIEMNSDSDIFGVPRVNRVEDITQEHIDKWGWRVDENGKINWPDFQFRIYKNNNIIKWERPVHEYLTGYKKFGTLPEDVGLALQHYKKIAKQEKQNELYQNIIKEKNVDKK